MSTLVIYRQSAKNVPSEDGFCCAYIAWLVFGYSAEYIPSEYHDRLPLETFKDRDVFFLDITYPREEMDAIYQVAKTLKVIDHHTSSDRAFDTAQYAVIDTDRSSVASVWNYFFPTQPIPVLVQHLNDYELHSDLDEHAKAFILKLKTIPYDFQKWDTLNTRLGHRKDQAFYTDFVSSGLTMLCFYKQQCEAFLNAAFQISLNGITGLAVNAPKSFSTDIGFALAGRSGTFGAVFYMRSDGRIEMQLRSKTVDVENIASHYNGGGYKNSSGLSISLAEFAAILDPAAREANRYARAREALELFANADFDSFVKGDLEAKLLNLLRGAGLEVDMTNVSVDATNCDKYKLLRRLGRGLAHLFRLPESDTQPKWYHKVLPYKVRWYVEFDDVQLAQIFALSRVGSRSSVNQMIENLIETVNRKYRADLIRDRYCVFVTIRFHDSNISIKRQFEA